MSSSSDHTWMYDVFISFRGKDTRYNFVSHLYAALSNAGIHTFLDEKRLKKGGELRPQLLGAIKGSRISIVVISVNYAESSWCLNELVHILECRKAYGQVVIPVFYDVDPTVVRKQKDDFGKGLKVNARKKDSNNQQEKQVLLSVWRSALTQVANMSGWDAYSFK